MASNAQDKESTLASEPLLQDLAEKLVEWKFLGRKLGLSEGTLDNIERDNKGESKEIKYKTLISWKRTSEHPTIGRLATALRKVDRADLATFVLQERIKPEPQVIPPQPKPVKKPSHNGIQSKAKMPGRHNIVLGNNSAEDTTLHRDRCREYGMLLQTKVHTFRYNKKPTETITGVLVYDNWDDDTGGTVQRIAGGPGQHFIEVKVQSQLHRGMDFTFSVYGRRR